MQRRHAVGFHERSNRGPGPVKISASRRVAAVSLHSNASFPRMMAVGGLFSDSEPFRTATGSGSERTGETSRTAPESGHRGAERRGGRQSTPARHRRAPGRLGQPRGPRAVPRRSRTGAVGVVALRSARTASRGSERSTSTPATRRVRRRATPRLCCSRGIEACRRAALLVNRVILSRAGIGDVLPAPLRFCGHRCGSVQHFVSIDSG